MRQSRNVARLAGATGLPLLLAVWGLGTLSVTGELTVATWALALGFVLPLSALLFLFAKEHPMAGLEPAYAVGFLAAIAVTTAGYLALATVARDSLAAVVAALDPLVLVAVAALAAGAGGLLTLVDVRYVERTRPVALLEAKYLDDPNENRTDA